jgi:hypothetical protein
MHQENLATLFFTGEFHDTRVWKFPSQLIHVNAKMGVFFQESVREQFLFALESLLQPIGRKKIRNLWKIWNFPGTTLSETALSRISMRKFERISKKCEMQKKYFNVKYSKVIERVNYNKGLFTYVHETQILSCITQNLGCFKRVYIGRNFKST